MSLQRHSSQPITKHGSEETKLNTTKQTHTNKLKDAITQNKHKKLYNVYSIVWKVETD